MTAGILCLLIIGAIAWPVSSGSGHRAAIRTSCLSNTKQLALAHLLYDADWDRLPQAATWCDRLVTYTHGREFRCPELPKEAQGFGYAMDSRLAEKRLASVDAPAKTPLIFESTNLAKNAADPMTSLPRPGRHTGKNNIGYADGHARAMSP